MEEGPIEATGIVLGETRKLIVRHLGVEVSLLSHLDLNREDSSHEVTAIVHGATQRQNPSLHGEEHRRRYPKTEGDSVVVKVRGEGQIGKPIQPHRGEVTPRRLEQGKRSGRKTGHSHAKMIVLKDQPKSRGTRERKIKVLFAIVV